MVGIEGLNMQSIELLVKSGLEYFSAECISPKSPMLLPLDKKISRKLDKWISLKLIDGEEKTAIKLIVKAV